MDNAKKPFHDIVAEKLIEQLKAGTAPWQKPWQPGEPNSFLPMNPTTGKRYKGINLIQLMSQGRSDPRWMTYKQAAAVGAQVRGGEKGTPVQYWKFSEEQDKLDDTGKPVLDAQGKPVKETVMLERPRVFFATVFNAEQIDGLPPIERKEPRWNTLERAEHILSASGAAIRHGESDSAFYRPATDSIHLPDKSQFATADDYYATALHELGHWTGHKSRLDRDLAHPFGSEGYAKEELRAEIASMILGDELGIGHDPGQHAAYVASWIKTLQEDPLEVFRAAAEAEKIQNYVLAFEQKHLQEHDRDQANNRVHAPAFFDADSKLRDSQTGELLPADWRGIAQSNGIFWYIGQESGERTFTTLAAKTLAAAEAEATIAEALAVDISEVLNNPDVSFSHYWAYQGATLDEALRCRGLTTVGSITGHDPTRFYHEAHNRLSPVFGINPADNDMGEPYLERKGLAEDVAAKAEQLHQAIRQRQEANVPEPGQYPAWALEYSDRSALARIHEEQVRLDPNSTDEDISAATEARKDSEATAMRSDADEQRRMTEHESHLREQPDTEGAREVPDKRMYLNVPYQEKEEAKALGARWDRQQQSWYVPPGVEPASFTKWTQDTATLVVQPAKRQKAPQERIYLAVPYAERSAAKAAGASWDKIAKSWYAGPKADMEKLQRWLPDNVTSQQAPAITPREEFAEALRSLGCLVTGEHPVMDGKPHRIGAQGDKQGEQAGFYVGHLDGHPAGYIKNNRTGIDMKWKSKGYWLNPTQKARLQAEAAAKLQARAAEQEQQHERTAQRLSQQLAELVPMTTPTPYLQSKGISPQAGVFTDQEGQTTYIPALDINGKQWTTQYIQEDGTKRFAKDSRKEGCFHPVGGLDALAKAPALIIAEGYATAASLSEALGFSVVAAFDSGNLPHVAKALHARFPEKPMIIAGDNDQHLETTQGINPGKMKAKEAAEAVGGRVMFPIFAPGEQARNPKDFTDFNDLANRSVLGREGIERQARAMVDRVIRQHQTRVIEQRQRQEHVQRRERQPRAIRL